MSPTQPPVISLLTDFGTTDPYVGMMKGVILARCPAAHIMDITHDVPPQNVAAAAYLLSASWSFFPPRTVHVSIVDPGVGSGRRILAASCRGHRFLAPDNGLLTAVFSEARPEKVFSVENDRLFLKPVSQTFHGRDIFAPVAAHLAAGMSLDDLGPPIDSWVTLPILEARRSDSGEIVGSVIYVDRFGNLVTNVRGVMNVSSKAEIAIAGRVIRGLTACYAGARPGELLAIIGSSGRVEIAVNQGSAHKVLGVSEGGQVRITQRPETQ